MKMNTIGFLAAMCLFAPLAIADEFWIPESLSPDGLYAIYAIDSSARGGMPDVQLRNVETGKVIKNHLHVSGYVSTAWGMTRTLRASWSPGSRWIVLQYRGTKTTDNVEFLYFDGIVVKEVEPPCYVQNVFGRAGVVRSGRRMAEYPITWNLPEVGESWARDYLVLGVSGTYPEEIHDDEDPRAWFRSNVTLRMTSGHSATPRITLVSVEEKHSRKEEE